MKIVKNEMELNTELPILASEKYLKIKSPKYGWIVDENFILPFFLDKRLIFTRIVFTYALIPQKENLTVEDEKKFLNKMIDFVRKQKICDFIYKAQSNVFFNVCPDGADCVEWGTYVKDIQMNDDELLMSFHSKHRNVIRKAIKEGVKIHITDDVNLIYQNIKETLDRQNSIHYPSKEYLTKLSKLKNNTLFLIAEYNDQIQGSAVIVYDKERAYYMYGGSIPRPFTGSVNLLQYEAMKILRDKGVKEYDFVGARINPPKNSKYEGIQRFKSRFGAELQKGYAFRYVFNPIKFKLFNIASSLYLKSKGYSYVDPIDSVKRGSE